MDRIYEKNDYRRERFESTDLNCRQIENEAVADARMWRKERQRFEWGTWSTWERGERVSPKKLVKLPSIVTSLTIKPIICVILIIISKHIAV